MASDDAIAWYYPRLYHNMDTLSQEFQDYTVNQLRDMLFSMLSGNTKYSHLEDDFYGKYCLNQAIKLAGSVFHVYEEDTEDVIVPYKKGADLIAELDAQKQPAPRLF